MVKLVITPLVFAALCIWMACSIDELPFTPMGDPAAKRTVAEDSCFVIQWDCDPSMWMTEADSVYSIFYQNYRFQARGSAVILTEYIDDSSKRVYEAHPTLSVFKRNRARFQWSDDEQCGLWSDAIRDTTVTTRVFKGDVQWMYRALPSYSQYAVKEDGVSYKIATVNADTTLRYVDFYGLHHRLNRPPSLDGKRYYLPINFSKSALDTLLHIPDNDSLYIESPFRCEDDDSCTEWPEAMCPEPVVVEVAAGTGGDSGVASADATPSYSSRLPHKGHCNFGSDNLGGLNFGDPCDPDGNEYPSCRNPTFAGIPIRVDCGNYALYPFDSNAGSYLGSTILDNGDTAYLRCGHGYLMNGNNFNCCPTNLRFNTETQACESTGEPGLYDGETFCNFGSVGSVAYRCNFGGLDPGFPPCASPTIRIAEALDCGYWKRVESFGPGIGSVSNGDGTFTYFSCTYGFFTNSQCCPSGQTFNTDTQTCE